MSLTEHQPDTPGLLHQFHQLVVRVGFIIRVAARSCQGYNFIVTAPGKIARGAFCNEVEFEATLAATSVEREERDLVVSQLVAVQEISQAFWVRGI